MHERTQASDEDPIESAALLGRESGRLPKLHCTGQINLSIEDFVQNHLDLNTAVLKDIIAVCNFPVCIFLNVHRVASKNCNLIC